MTLNISKKRLIMKKDYSIIIPHKNCPELLQRCINSIPKDNNIQIIVVDDNSDIDKRPNIIEPNCEVFFLREDESRGAGKARNVGLTHAVGEWVIFADSDDFFSSQFYNILREYKHDESDIIFFNVESVMSYDITIKATRTKDYLFERGKIQGSDVFRYAYCEPWGKMIKRNLISNNRIWFDETKVSNDYYFSVKSGCMASKIKIIDLPLYVVTLRENSLSYNFADTKEKILTRIDVAIRVQKILKEYGYKEKPMPIRGLMVLLLKKHPLLFFKKLVSLIPERINILSLLYQMFNPKYFRSHH